MTDIKDNQWVRQSFLVTKDNLDSSDHVRRFLSSASFKFTDTTLGGNFAINPPPQFTASADLKVTGTYSGSEGMGRYYSEAIDDNSQIIHMRFGVPQFNSLTTFFTGFYSSAAGQLARTGRASSAFFELGTAAGFIVSIVTWQLLAVNLVGTALRFALQKPASKYYYLKPTMPLYWNAVTTIVNQIAVNKGIVPRLGGEDQGVFNQDYQFDSVAVKALHKMLPDIIDKNGAIDVYAMANRAQRLANKRHKAMQAQLDSESVNPDTYATKLQAVLNTIHNDTKPDLPAYMKRWFSSKPSEPAAASSSTSSTTDSSSTTTATAASTAVDSKTSAAAADAATELYSKEESAWTNFESFLNAELDDGSAFASFRVNYTGSTNESFSSSVMESELSNKINGMSASSRSTRFSFADGNIGGGILGEAVGAVFGAAKSFIAGVGNGLEISGLAALSGSAFVDIPKSWQSSSAQLPRANYTINLVSPYGNPISQMFNLYVPLAMLLAGALPISTGKQSYTSPFLVELYDQGRCQTRLGIIDSISITRGTGNLGFNNLGHAMGIDVSFSVIDMSSIMHMPITQATQFRDLAVGAAGAAGGALASGLVAAAMGAFDDDTVFSDYMNVLGAVGLSEQIYVFKKLKMQLTKKMATWNSWTSPAHFIGIIGDTAPARLISAFYTGTIK